MKEFLQKPLIQAILIIAILAVGIYLVFDRSITYGHDG